MRITVDFAELTKADKQFEKLGNDIPEIRSRFLKKSAELITRRAALHHRFESRTGALERAIESNLKDDTVELTLNPLTAPYATFIHEGTGMWGPERRKYAIYPREQRALKFEGEDAFARKVNHPGIEPDPFLFEAADAVDEELLNIIGQEFGLGGIQE
jgi:recombinational DNA repair ATPase RecF